LVLDVTSGGETVGLALGVGCSTDVVLGTGCLVGLGRGVGRLAGLALGVGCFSVKLPALLPFACDISVLTLDVCAFLEIRKYVIFKKSDFTLYTIRQHKVSINTFKHHQSVHVMINCMHY
jgi:hypothetical protein